MFSALNDVMKVPPGGWRYTQTDTGMELSGGDYYSLRERVRRHRQLNALAVGPELDDEIQAQICDRIGPVARAQFCRDKVVRVGDGGRSVEFADVKHFLSTVSKLRRFVSQTEANRRAEICASCPRNSPIAGCTGCRNLVGLLFNVIGNRHTPLDTRLGACGVCGCSLAASVHVPLENFPIVKGHVYPDWCWRTPGR
jgi:hypothetical protein